MFEISVKIHSQFVTNQLFVGSKSGIKRNRYFHFPRIPEDVAAADDLKKSSLQQSSTQQPGLAQDFNGFEKTIELIVLHKSFLFCDKAKVKLTSGLSQQKLAANIDRHTRDT